MIYDKIPIKFSLSLTPFLVLRTKTVVLVHRCAVRLSAVKSSDQWSFKAKQENKRIDVGDNDVG